MTIGLTEEHRDLRDAVRAFTSRRVTQAVVREAVDAGRRRRPRSGTAWPRRACSGCTFRRAWAAPGTAWSNSPSSWRNWAAS